MAARDSEHLIFKIGTQTRFTSVTHTKTLPNHLTPYYKMSHQSHLISSLKTFRLYSHDTRPTTSCIGYTRPSGVVSVYLSLPLQPSQLPNENTTYTPGALTMVDFWQAQQTQKLVSSGFNLLRAVSTWVRIPMQTSRPAVNNWTSNLSSLES